MTVAWRPRKPRLHNRRCVRVPKAPLNNGPLRHVAEKLRQKLLVERRPPPSLASQLELPGRANRCDGLESIWMVIYCLLAFMSLKSLRVGYRQRPADPKRRKYDLVGVSIKQICGWTGLEQSCVSHVLTLLRRVGYVQGPGKDHVNVIKQPWETLESGALAPLPAIRRFEFVLFAELGLGAFIAGVRRGKPAPTAAPPTVHPESARALIRDLADHNALDGPPDG